MKTVNLLAASLTLGTIAAAGSSSVLAQDTMTTNKPVAMTNAATGKPILVIPQDASRIDKYKTSWAYRNLDAVEVKRYRDAGFSDSTIRGAANIAVNAGLSLDFVLRQVREVGLPLYLVAEKYGLSTRVVDSDFPGYGLESAAVAPAPMMTRPMGMSGAMEVPTAVNSSASQNTVATASAPVTQGTIVDIASANPDLTTLVAAIKAANLVDTFNGPGPFTLFAPTNEAFAKLPAGTVNDLLKPENQDKLRALLTYHVVPGKVMATDVMGMSNPSAPKTVNGATLSVKTTAPVMINGANVTQTDIVASNGVIHIIDSVLMPPAQ